MTEPTRDPLVPPGYLDEPPPRRRWGCSVFALVVPIVAAAVLLALTVLLLSGGFAPASSEGRGLPPTAAALRGTPPVPQSSRSWNASRPQQRDRATVCADRAGSCRSLSGAPQPAVLSGTSSVLDVTSTPAPTGAVGSARYSATATWCAPTPTQCTRWGGNAKLAAVHSFRFGDEPYLVKVERGNRSVTVLVVSYCACRGTDRAIDLSPFAFRQLAPLSRGRIDVVMEWPVPEPPRTPDDLRMMREVSDDEVYR
jgi:hypothetical protein